MNNKIIGQIIATRDKLSDELLPIKMGIFIYFVLQSASFAVVSNNVAVVLGIVNVVEFDDVWMI